MPLSLLTVHDKDGISTPCRYSPALLQATLQLAGCKPRVAHKARLVSTKALLSSDRANEECTQASKAVFNELSCLPVMDSESAAPGIDRVLFNELVHKHVKLHREQVLSQADLHVACRCFLQHCANPRHT